MTKPRKNAVREEDTPNINMAVAKRISGNDAPNLKPTSWFTALPGYSMRIDPAPCNAKANPIPEALIPLVDSNNDGKMDQ